jgi:hypothetical protein
MRDECEGMRGKKWERRSNKKERNEGTRGNENESE